MADSSDLLGSLMGQLGGGGITEIARSVGVSGSDVTSVLGGADARDHGRPHPQHFVERRRRRSARRA